MKKINQNWFYSLIGIIGAFISLLGLTQSSGSYFFITGSSLLLIAAVRFKLFFFIALEIILISGHGAILLGIGTILQFALPVLLCFQLLVFYYLSGKADNFILLIGIAGIAILSIGFSYENQWIFFIGSTAIAIYALYDAKKHQMSLLWGILNIIFALIAAIHIGISFY